MPRPGQRRSARTARWLGVWIALAVCTATAAEDVRLTNAGVVRYLAARQEHAGARTALLELAARSKLTRAEAAEIERCLRQLQAEQPWREASQVSASTSVERTAEGKADSIDVGGLYVGMGMSEAIMGLARQIPPAAFYANQKEILEIAEAARAGTLATLGGPYARMLRLVKKVAPAALPWIDEELRIFAAGRDGPHLTAAKAMVRQTSREFQEGFERMRRKGRGGKSAPPNRTKPAPSKPPVKRPAAGEPPPGFWDGPRAARNRAVVRRALTPQRPK